MDYFVARAEDVARLSSDQLDALHTFEETEFNRCLMPYETTQRLRLKTLKAHWDIPTDENAQAAHTQRIKLMLLARPWFRGEFRRMGAGSVELVHAFDEFVHADPGLDFQCVESSGHGRRLREDLS